MNKVDYRSCGLVAPPDERMAARKPLRATKFTQRDDAIRAYVTTNRSAIGRLVRGVFEIQTFEEAEKLSSMLGLHCPDPASASVGIWELLSNAIEHGNLAIDRQQKADLLSKGTYWEELTARLASDRYSERFVVVDFRRNRASIRIRVADQGDGFDHAKILSEDPSDDAPNGRGLLMARKMAFHRLKFSGAGNIVDATIRC